MSADVVLAVVLLVAAVVMLTLSAPAMARLGRDQTWAVRLVGDSLGIAALWAAATAGWGLGAVILWRQTGVVVLVVTQAVVARISRRRARRAQQP